METYQSRWQVRPKHTEGQGRYQKHNDMWDLQTILRGPGWPLNEAAKEPAASVGALRFPAWHLGQYWPYEGENEDFNVVEQMAAFHHCIVTLKRWFFERLLAIHVRRDANKMMSVLQKIFLQIKNQTELQYWVDQTICSDFFCKMLWEKPKQPLGSPNIFINDILKSPQYLF